MRLTIQIATDNVLCNSDDLNILFQDCQKEIGDFILNRNCNHLSSMPRIKDEEYQLEVVIEPDEHEVEGKPLTNAQVREQLYKLLPLFLIQNCQYNDAERNLVIRLCGVLQLVNPEYEKYNKEHPGHGLPNQKSQ